MGFGGSAASDTDPRFLCFALLAFASAAVVAAVALVTGDSAIAPFRWRCDHCACVNRRGRDEAEEEEEREEREGMTREEDEAVTATPLPGVAAGTNDGSDGKLNSR